MMTTSTEKPKITYHGREGSVSVGAGAQLPDHFIAYILLHQVDASKPLDAAGETLGRLPRSGCPIRGGAGLGGILLN
jgi:hypothetical protein